MFRGRSRLEVLGTRHASLDGQTVSYVLKRSRKARLARLEIDPESGLTVVLPYRYSPAEASKLLAEKKRWVLGKLAHCRRQAIASEVQSDTALYLGQRYRVEEHTGRIEGVTIVRDRLVMSVPPRKTPGQVLEGWYQQQAGRLLGQRVDELSRKLGLSFNRCTVRSARTRWGSCSQKGSVSLNWKLIMAPQPVIDYVVIHELLHLREMNHSKRFWRLVAERCPDWREHKAWLKEHQMELARGPFSAGKGFGSPQQLMML